MDTQRNFEKRIETDAIDAYTAPENIILRAIRNCSTKLHEELGKLRDRGAQLLNVSTLNRVETALGYVEKLDENIAKANTIDISNSRSLRRQNISFKILLNGPHH